MSQAPFGRTRTRVHHDHALIGEDSHVTAPLYGWKDTFGVMLISPAMASARGTSAVRGPGFAQYMATLTEQSRSNTAPAGIERCLIVLDGRLSILGKELQEGSFAYLPADVEANIRGLGSAKILVFEKHYVPHPDLSPPDPIIGELSSLKPEPFLGDEDAMLANLLPDEPSFDMAVNVFTYQSGAVLPFVETHIMEHGLYMSAGQGIYRLGESWYPVCKGDSIWMAAYCPQWFVAMGKEPAQYIYYKDVHRNHLPEQSVD
ncbi:MAG: (S)-ureidoglycine aminohydrolase [Planctomycetota bacterium]